MFEFLKEFIYFENCIHTIYKDHSAIIYQPNGILTYFNSNGNRNRIKIENCRKSDNLHLKVQEMLNLCSLYTNLNPNQIEYEEVIKNTKIQKILWPTTYQILENEAILKSIDGYATIKLNLNTFKLNLTYYQYYQPVALQQNSENQQDYINNFFKKYNLGQQKSTSQINVGYTYRKINKIYSLINFPIQFIGPFFILVKDFLNDEKLQQLDIQFPTELIDYLLQDIEQQDTNYYLNLYGCYKNESTLITNIFDEIQQSNIFINDTVSPVMNKISQINLGKPIFMFQGQIEFWFQNETGIGTINDKLLRREGIFWEYEEKKWEQSIYNDKFELSNIEVYIKHLKSKYSQDQNQVIKQLVEKQKPIEYYKVEIGNLQELNKIEIKDIGEFILLKNGTLKAKFIDRTVITFKYPPPCNIRIISQQGEIGNIEFCPIQDERLFHSYMHYLEYFQNELQPYMEYCLKMAEDNFATQEILSQRSIHQNTLKSMIDNEIEKNERFLIWSGGMNIPEIQQEENITLEEQIQRLLNANEQMLMKLKQ